MRFKYYLSSRCPVCASISTPICRDFEFVFPGISDFIYVDKLRIGLNSFYNDPRAETFKYFSPEGRVPVFVFDDPPPLLDRSECKISVRVGVSIRPIVGYELAHKAMVIYLLERGYDLDLAMDYAGGLMDSTDDYRGFLEAFRSSAYEGGY